MKDSRGTKMAREIRKQCNNMTREERHLAYEHAMKIINGNHK